MYCDVGIVVELIFYKVRSKICIIVHSEYCNNCSKCYIVLFSGLHCKELPSIADADQRFIGQLIAKREDSWHYTRLHIATDRDGYDHENFIF